MDLFKVVTPFMFLFIFIGFVTGDVAVNCGSDGNSGAFDGRQWVGDGTSSELVPKGKSKSSIAADKSFSADPVPYKTSRISASPFQYEFRVTAGQKFIRLHFYPAYYAGFRNSEDMFTVKAGPFTLLKDFSASFAAQTLGVEFLVKEFCLNIEQNSVLTIYFSPSQRSSASRKVVAFVNGIEVISMPTGLYYTKDSDSGARIVGMHNRFSVIDNSTALELVERLNTGGTTVLPVEDFGLFRRWNGDSSYLMETGVHQVLHPASIHADAAPSNVYQTSWRMEPNARAQGLYVFRWKIPVDVGFGYLVRLHFCHFGAGVEDGGKKEFTVVMNDQIAETEVDLISSGGRGGVLSYRDYVVLMKGVKEVGKCNLLIVLRSTDERVVGLLSGLEIFKLSNLHNNLAAPNFVLLRTTSSPTSWKEKIHKLFTLSKFNVIATVITLLLVLVNVTAHYLRQSWEESITREKDTMWHSIDPSFYRFSLYEIQSATQNFSDAAVIGRGGFGMVYKGFLNRISQVAAIKRLKADSKQGAREFRSEVETLSKFRHTHLVSLIGYCNERSEMILVYEYMPRGTLADHIYKLAQKGKDYVFLSWEQRLSICIGAARGLEYLHTGTEQGVIHRDVKDTNILLDENFVAKVSDFGLSKFEVLSESKSYMSTNVRGTHGYLDPEYHRTGMLTRMVDVYAFGVVLLVVLSGRPVFDFRNTGEVQSLLSCFMDCIAGKDFKVIIDPGLRESVVASSLNEFVKTAEGCLCPQPKRRPTMAQVAASLDRAKEMQLRSIKKATRAARLPWISAADFRPSVEIRRMLNMKDLTQVSMVSRLKHDNLVELLGYCVEGNISVLAYECSTMGSLHGRKGVQAGPVLDWITRVRIAVDAARGLEYLHDKVNPAIIHRDIRSSNVLVFKDYKAKIADFNLSNQAPDMAARMGPRILGTFGYRAPEYRRTGQLTQESDVYSFGVVLLELLTGRKPVDEPRGESLVTWATPRLCKDKIKECIDPKLKDFPPKGVEKLAAVAALCVQDNAGFRPTMSIVVKALQPLLKAQVLAPPPEV